MVFGLIPGFAFVAILCATVLTIPLVQHKPTLNFHWTMKCPRLGGIWAPSMLVNQDLSKPAEAREEAISGPVSGRPSQRGTRSSEIKALYIDKKIHARANAFVRLSASRPVGQDNRGRRLLDRSAENLLNLAVGHDRTKSPYPWRPLEARQGDAKHFQFRLQPEPVTVLGYPSNEVGHGHNRVHTSASEIGKKLEFSIS